MGKSDINCVAFKKIDGGGSLPSLYLKENEKLFFFIFLCYCQLFILDSVAVQAQDTIITVKGYVIAEENRRPLRDVTISYTTSDIKTITRADGSYSFTISRVDSIIISITYKGYIEIEEKVIVTKNSDVTVKDFILTKIGYQSDEIVVSANRVIPYLTLPTQSITEEQIKRVPVVVETDAQRSMQLLPGVAVSNEISAQLIVRGGEQSQHLILVDGAPLYNAFHLGGVFSAVNPEVIKQTDLFASAYPLNYSGAVSSLFSMLTKDDIPERFTANANISLISTKASAFTKIGNGSLLFAARRTYFDLISQLVFGRSAPYTFYDLYGKYNVQIDPHHQLATSILYVRDDADVFSASSLSSAIGETIQPTWGNLVGTVNWNWQINSAQTLVASLYSTSNSITARRQTSVQDSSDTEDIFEIGNRITEQGIKGKFEWDFLNHDITVGIDLSVFRSTYKWNISQKNNNLIVAGPNIFYDGAPQIYQNKFDRWKTGLYFSDKFLLQKNTIISIGSRIDYLSDQSRFLLSPFSRIDYDFTSKIKSHISYGRYYQHLITLSEKFDTYILAGFKVFFLPTKEKIPFADHLTAGVDIAEVLPGLSISAESYWFMKRNMPSASVPEGVQQLYEETGIGLDVMARYRRGSLEGWISYSAMRISRNQSGFQFPGQYDQPQSVKVFLAYRPTNNLDISTSWIMASGLPYSTTSLPTQQNPTSPADLVAINNARGPLYHRLDVTLSHSFAAWGALAKPYLTLINAYSNNNSYATPRGSYPALPVLVPIIGIGLEF